MQEIFRENFENQTILCFNSRKCHSFLEYDDYFMPFYGGDADRYNENRI